MKRLEWNLLTASERAAVLRRPRMETDQQLQQNVADILARVRAGGDQAVIDYTRQFDDVAPASLWQDSADHAPLPADLDAAIDRAIATVSAFHARGKPQGYALETAPGVVCESRWVALDPVGLYVPAGTAPLPSTAIMLSVPARLAGCKQLVLATPPNQAGQADPAVLAVAAKLGISKVLIAGGAQAIAAMAWGTESVPNCVKLFGPGNRFVAEAKRQAAADPDGAAQDLPAGPSEVMVVADQHARADWVAMDLLSQAEHGPDSQVILVTDSSALAEAVQRAVETQLSTLPRREMAAKSLQSAAILLVNDINDMVDVCEQYAPEHLIVNLAQAPRLTDQLRSAGSVFVGPYTPESLGDYVSGTNHTLPTGGWARAHSGLSTLDFMRRMTLQTASAAGLQSLGPAAARLARHEGLDAHRLAVEMRLDALENGQ
ncbi:MAG: histidinol dehydrogenase [Pseudomonadota bacterium]